MGLIVLGFVSLLLGLAGAGAVAPWLFVVGLGGVLLLVFDRVTSWFVVRFFS